jgi:hypothetical protein
MGRRGIGEGKYSKVFLLQRNSPGSWNSLAVSRFSNLPPCGSLSSSPMKRLALLSLALLSCEKKEGQKLTERGQHIVRPVKALDFETMHTLGNSGTIEAE